MWYERLFLWEAMCLLAADLILPRTYDACASRLRRPFGVFPFQAVGDQHFPPPIPS